MECDFNVYTLLFLLKVEILLFYIGYFHRIKINVAENEKSPS